MPHFTSILKRSTLTVAKGLCRHSKALDKLRSHVRPSASERIEKSISYFENIRNKHSGKRGFVIGNGPSLKLSDLEALRDEITIASNKVYLAFNQTNWRPTYYTVADNLLWQKVYKKIPESIRIIHVPHYLDPGFYRRNKQQVFCWRHINWDADALPAASAQWSNHFSPDAANGFYGSWTVTYENLQLAVHLGLNPIYLIGCDHYYAGEDKIVAGQRVRVGAENNHFITGYRQPGEEVNPAPIALMEIGYRVARKFSDQTDIKIYNATRGGYLEIFERRNLDEILGN